MDQADYNDDSYSGYDIEAQYANPLLSPFFHDPFPTNPESTAYVKALWNYATGVAKGNPADPNHEKISGATALLHVDHVYFPLAKFKANYYFNTKTKYASQEGFESLLHEAFHIWNGRHQSEVNDLLASPGGYNNRVAQSKKICDDFVNKISTLNKTICGSQSRKELVDKILGQVKWPQRYGSYTGRKYLMPLDKYRKDCKDTGSEMKLEGQTVCVCENDYCQTGDLHSMDNGFEYFAILMQLYVVSPDDFARVASPVEAIFAKKFYSETLNHP